MPAFVIKRTDFVATPANSAFAFKDMAHVRNPHLFRKGFGNLLFAIGLSGQIAKLCVHPIGALLKIRCILIHLEWSRQSRHTSRKTAGCGHVIGILTVVRIFCRNSARLLPSVQELGTEPLPRRHQHKGQDKNANGKNNGRIHY